MGRQEKTTPKTYQIRVSVNALQNIEEITGYIAFINQQPRRREPRKPFEDLDKINRKGLGSLNKKEKETLEAYSKNVR